MGGRALLILLLATTMGASASDHLAGPVSARVLRVIDGDTVMVRAHIWLGQELETAVRLRGIDTPEIRGRCADERAKAESARRFLEERLGGAEILLRDISFGKYAGRVLARVEGPDGVDGSEALVKRGLARPYDGGQRATWCP